MDLLHNNFVVYSNMFMVNDSVSQFLTIRAFISDWSP